LKFDPSEALGPKPRVPKILPENYLSKFRKAFKISFKKLDWFKGYST
jgi:hypothetical protein